MNKTNKYKVTLEFEVAINPVIVPDINTFEKNVIAKRRWWG